MDAAALWTRSARPQGTWKTAQDAVSHSAHTHHRLLWKEKNDGDSTNVTKPSTESDQGYGRPRYGNNSRMPTPSTIVFATFRADSGRLSAM